jgi:hypothetical protein
MPVSQQHHQGVAVTMTIGFGRLDQPLDIGQRRKELLY